MTSHERGLSTDRRMAAVELLLDLGYRWNDGKWEAPARIEASLQAAGVGEEMPGERKYWLPKVPKAYEGHVTQDALSRALSMVYGDPWWREDAKPLGTFISGYTAQESNAYCILHFGPENVCRALDALAGPNVADEVLRYNDQGEPLNPKIGAIYPDDDGALWRYEGAGEWKEVELAAAPMPPAAPGEGLSQWREALIDGLVVAEIYQAKHDNDPRGALNDLICWHVTVALDPSVSSEAAKLLERAPPLTENEDAALCRLENYHSGTGGDAETVCAALRRLSGETQP